MLRKTLTILALCLTMTALRRRPQISREGVSRHNVYDLNGAKVLTNADNLHSLAPGVYIVNGVKTLIEK